MIHVIETISHIPIEIWKMLHVKKKRTYERYIKYGMRINAEMRERFDFKTRTLVQDIEDDLISLGELLGDNKKTICFYRCMKKPFNKNLQTGFTSTSNIPVLKFGTYVYKVIIFPTTKIDFFDISKHIHRNRKWGTIFEIFVSSKVKFELFTHKNENYLIPISN